MFHRVVVSTTSVPELATTQDGAVGEVEPQVVGQVTFLALPTFGRNLPCCFVLGQVFGMPRKTELIRALEADSALTVVVNVLLGNDALVSVPSSGERSQLVLLRSRLSGENRRNSNLQLSKSNAKVASAELALEWK